MSVSLNPSSRHSHSGRRPGRVFLIKLIVAVAIVAASCFYTLSRQSSPSAAPVAAPVIDRGPLRVVRIVDGDTIHLSDGENVRYLGIDTPETRLQKNGHWIDAPQPFGKEAKEFNRQLVLGKAITLEFDVEKKDKYHRTLAYCFVEGKSVSAELLKGGYAVVFTKAPNVKYADEFVRLQDEARLARRGLWGACATIAAVDAGLSVPTKFVRSRN